MDVDVSKRVAAMATAFVIAYPRTVDSVIKGVRWVNNAIPFIQLAIQQAETHHIDIPERIDSVVEVVEKVTEPSVEYLDQKAEIDERPIREDAQLAADVIEKATNEVNQEISLQEAFAPAAEAKLNDEFNQKMQDLEKKLDKKEETYFKRHPDLSQEERDAAGKRFGKIRDEEVGVLENEKAERLAELQKAQEAKREDLDQRRRELEGTRADR